MAKKKLPKLQQFDRVEIGWLDAYEKGGWQNLEDQKIESHPVKITSVGMFLESGKDYIAFCDSSNHAQEPDRMVNNIMKIPLVAVVSVKKLR